MSPYDYIKKEIICGNLLPGAIFDEKIVQEKLNVSRTPVREAVLRLSNEGYLTIIPRKGTIVSNISINDIKNIYEYRMIIEPEIVKKAIKTVNQNFLLEQKELIKEKLLDDNLLLDDYDKEFHIGIAKALNNNYIEKEVSRLLDLSERIRFLSSNKSHERYIASLYEHLNIIEAMLNKDEDSAYEAMLKHLYNTLEGFKILWN